MNEAKTSVKRTLNPFVFLRKQISRLWKKQETNVYFISGMCYNCKVFDKLKLPQGYNKKYIEWHIPRPDETLYQYARTMAKKIDTSQPFILVGYSFGAIIMQEMNLFLFPRKSIIISSFKKAEEIPTLFKVVKMTHLTEKIPTRIYSSTKFVTNAFNQFVYHMPNADFEEFMTVVDPIYIKWAINRITDWIPEYKCKNLYHIHGTKDQIFPYELISNAFPIEDGDHLMIVKKTTEVNSILNNILLIKESNP